MANLHTDIFFTFIKEEPPTIIYSDNFEGDVDDNYSVDGWTKTTTGYISDYSMNLTNTSQSAKPYNPIITHDISVTGFTHIEIGFWYYNHLPTNNNQGIHFGYLVDDEVQLTGTSSPFYNGVFTDIDKVTGHTSGQWLYYKSPKIDINGRSRMWIEFHQDMQYDLLSFEYIRFDDFEISGSTTPLITPVPNYSGILFYEDYFDDVSGWTLDSDWSLKEGGYSGNVLAFSSAYTLTLYNPSTANKYAYSPLISVSGFTDIQIETWGRGFFTILQTQFNIEMQYQFDSDGWVRFGSFWSASYSKFTSEILSVNKSTLQIRYFNTQSNTGYICLDNLKIFGVPI